MCVSYCTSCKGALQMLLHAQCCPVTDHAHLRAKALHVVHIAGRVVIYIMAVSSTYTFANEGRDVFLSVDKDIIRFSAARKLYRVQRLPLP